jgi:hypothetical protein
MEKEQQGTLYPEDRGHLVELLNMSLQDLWNLAYQLGYEDGFNQASSQQDQSGTPPAG